MDWGSIVLALIGAIGGGGIVAIVQAIANSKKINAEAHKIDHEANEIAERAEGFLIDRYKDRLARLDQRANEQDGKLIHQAESIDKLRDEICTLRDEIRGRDQKIKELEQLKVSQQKQIELLQDEVKERDRKIAEQSKTIEYLASRVTELECAVKRLERADLLK